MHKLHTRQDEPTLVHSRRRIRSIMPRSIVARYSSYFISLFYFSFATVCLSVLSYAEVIRSAVGQVIVGSILIRMNVV